MKHYGIDLQSRYDRLKGQEDTLLNQRGELIKDIEQLIKESEEWSEALDICLTAGKAIQDRLVFYISSIVTKALKTVFPNPYTFRMDYNVRGGTKSQAIPILERDGEEYDPLSSCGGGVVDVISFALRVSCLLLTRPSPNRVLILDEPFRFVSRDLQPRVREMLEMLSDELKIQFIIVTHEEEIQG